MKKTKAQLEAELDRARLTIAELKKINLQQLDRLVGDTLQSTRILELEGMLDDAIDERDKARERAQQSEEQLQKLAQERGMR